ncbi:DUF3617 domain-containing protein [Sphingomonas parva]|uniref:DUF3617 domain-containing protein n=1 Tax=Sphingomonas parva TaxID=2555898 RepID=A0A4Y8ZRN5_9SPHN|nr:DUF3617 domain-containing protein [Sphingomonas parva]TFI57449.1 DUF3617 domain-containing protein [Sphingomonas parva]
MIIRIPLAVASVLALAACGGGGESKAGGNASSETAAARKDGGHSSNGAVGGDIKLRPGQWEVTAEVDMPGMPKEVAEMMRKSQANAKTVMCITEEEANRSDANVFTGKKDKNCTSEGFEARSGRISGKVVCTGDTGEGRMTMVVDGTFQPESYEVRMKMDTEGPDGAGMKMETKATGKRIGDCPASEKA